MDIGPPIREIVAHPASDPVPEVIPIESPRSGQADRQDGSVPASR